LSYRFGYETNIAGIVAQRKIRIMRYPCRWDSHSYRGDCMRLPFLSMSINSPFEGLQEHAEKVKECASVFQEAMECIIQERCENFEHFRKRIDKLESEADAIKRRYLH
jgi:hypothetical protein